MATGDAISKFVIFAAGAILGSLATWQVLKAKYEQISKEEIESVKETFSKRYSEDSEDTKEAVNPTIDERKDEVNKDVIDYSKLVVNSGYTNYSKPAEKEEEPMEEKSGPYIIHPDDFGEMGYDEASYTYYSDGVLTDEFDDILDDDEVDALVGLDSLNHFGEYEANSVFVRNDDVGVDYEILRADETYEETHPEG